MKAPTLAIACVENVGVHKQLPQLSASSISTNSFLMSSHLQNNASRHSSLPQCLCGHSYFGSRNFVFSGWKRTPQLKHVGQFSRPCDSSASFSTISNKAFSIEPVLPRSNSGDASRLSMRAICAMASQRLADLGNDSISTSSEACALCSAPGAPGMPDVSNPAVLRNES